MLGEPSANSSGDRKDEILIDSWPQVRTTQTHLHPTCQGCEKKRKKNPMFWNVQSRNEHLGTDGGEKNV